MATYDVLDNNTGLMASLLDYFQLEESTGNRLSQTYSTNYLAPAGNTGNTGNSVGIINNCAFATESSSSATVGNYTSSISYPCYHEWSVSFWLKLQDAGNGAVWLPLQFGSIFGIVANDNGVDYGINVHYNGNTYNGGAITYGSWNHIVLTISPSASQVKLYINNALEFTQAVPVPVFGGQILGLTAFVGPGGASAFFDELGIWARVLTSTEVSTLYNTGAGDAWSFGTTFYPYLGSTAGGAATAGMNYTITASGGAKCGGVASVSNSTTEPASGGAICGGVSSNGRTYNQPASGGAVCGGAASNGKTYNQTASGGAICGGAASPSETYQPIAGGGAVAGGQQLNTMVINSLATSGGVVCGGKEGYTYDEVGSGGAVCAGVCLIDMPQQTGDSSGGCNVSGSAIVEADYSAVASGGAIVWSPLFNDGTAYTRLLEIQAGKITADVKGHVWPVTVSVDPGTVYYGRITITDMSGNPLPYKLVSYDYGTFKFYFRADASASLLNQYQFNWG